jgi:hypothetical protein
LEIKSDSEVCFAALLLWSPARSYSRYEPLLHTLPNL